MQLSCGISLENIGTQFVPTDSAIGDTFNLNTALGSDPRNTPEPLMNQSLANAQACSHLCLRYCFKISFKVHGIKNSSAIFYLQ